MTKTKKWSCAVGILLIGMIILFVITFFPKSVEAYTGTNYYSAEQYTESDQLLQADGTEAQRDIKDFAQDVKAGYINQPFPELAQVIPLEYLEATETNAEFAYNGKEYGFYVAKEGNYFDVFLIDFVYEFDDIGHTNNEYKIRIEPILQQRFLRTVTADSYQWEKTANHYKYYVANPRFLTVVQNENDLNYGDNGYSKQTDDGLIIFQTRLNYSKISYQTEDDYWANCLEFLGDKILSTATDSAVAFLDSYTGGFASFFKDMLDLNEKLYEAGQETKIEANNEVNIFTQRSKNEQRNSSKDGYSRVAAFRPEDEIVLAAADETSDDINDNSYAEFIVVLNETNYRTRLNQYCEFDIVRRTGQYSSMEEVNDPDKGEFYSFSKERILFSEGSEKLLAFDESATAYNLPHGTDSFKFTPAVSGTYTFTADDSRARLSLYSDSEREEALFNEKSSYSVYLQGGTNYLLDASMTGENKGRYEVAATVDAWIAGTTKTNQSIPADGQLYKITSAQKGGYQIESSNPNLRFRLYDADMRYLYETESNVFSQYLTPGDTYYLCAYSITNTVQTATLSFSEVDEIEQGEEYTVSEKDPAMYKFSAPNDLDGKTYYSIVFKNVSNDFDAEIFEYTGTIDYASSADFQSMSLYLEPGEEIYIQLSASGSFTIKIDQSQNLIAWVVNGEVQETNTVYLQRGSQWEIGLEMDGIAVNNVIYSSDMLLDNGKILDLTEYEKISDPTDESTYLYFYAIENDSPIPLKVCVIHDFHFVFDVYNDNSGYGFQWEAISADDRESFTINYAVTAGGKTKEAETDHIRDASKQSVQKLIEADLNYSGAQDISIEIISAVFWIDDDPVAAVYNSGYEDNNNLDRRALYQNFSCEKLFVNPLFADGSGTVSDPYQIANARHLDNLRKTSTQSYYYEVVKNITIDVEWEPIKEFYGNLNSTNNSCLTFKDGYNVTSDVCGFIKTNFGSINGVYFNVANMEISQGDEDPIESLTGEFFKMGIVAGINRGSIENVRLFKARLTVEKVNAYVGGIVGYNYFDGTISDCENYSYIGGACNIGGIAGATNGNIENCVNYGAMTITVHISDDIAYNRAVGGIVGIAYDECRIESNQNRGSIICYNDTDNPNLCPYMGTIAGAMACSESDFDENNSTGSLAPNALHSGGALWWQYDQLKNVGKILNGQVGNHT